MSAIACIEIDIVVTTCGTNEPTVAVTGPVDVTNAGDIVALTVVASDPDTACGVDDEVTLFTEFLIRPIGSSAGLTGDLTDTPSFLADLPGTDAIRNTSRGLHLHTESLCGDHLDPYGTVNP